jgi:hypothetical protein
MDGVDCTFDAGYVNQVSIFSMVEAPGAKNRQRALATIFSAAGICVIVAQNPLQGGGSQGHIITSPAEK